MPAVNYSKCVEGRSEPGPAGRVAVEGRAGCWAQVKEQVFVVSHEGLDQAPASSKISFNLDT